MSGAASRRRGHNAERAVVRYLKTQGFVDACTTRAKLGAAIDRWLDNPNAPAASPGLPHADLLIRIRERIENAASSTEQNADELDRSLGSWDSMERARGEAAGLRRALVIIARCCEPPARADRGVS